MGLVSKRLPHIDEHIGAPRCPLGVGTLCVLLFAVRSSDTRGSSPHPQTASRPLPTQRLRPREAFVFGIVTATVGLTWLALSCPARTLALAAATLVTYVCVYTPLKRVTALSVIVGAIPGALPPVIGWSVAAPLNMVAASLFGIVFLWQVPHVMAIAWIYHDDYRAGGLHLLPSDGRNPRSVGLLAVAYAVALCGVSLVPRWFGAAGHWYALCALSAGVAYVAAAIGFVRKPSLGSARHLLQASLWYLPAVFGALAVEQIWWLRL